MNTKTRRFSLSLRDLITLGVLGAMAYAVMALVHIKLVDFLTYDPKDVVISITGFIYGPLCAFVVSAVVGLLEMVTVSTTGPFGMMMNVLSSCAFACTAAFIYKKKRTMGGAVLGLGAGVIAVTGVMLLWNYLVSPLYMGVPRDVVQGMLLPLFLPFNLIKGSLNAALTILIYKPLITALRKANLVPQRLDAKQSRISPGLLIAAGLVLATCVLVVLVMNKVI